MRTVSCPACGNVLPLVDALLGQTIPCPSCGKSFVISSTPRRRTEALPPPAATIDYIPTPPPPVRRAPAPLPAELVEEPVRYEVPRRRDSDHDLRLEHDVHHRNGFRFGFGLAMGWFTASCLFQCAGLGVVGLVAWGVIYAIINLASGEVANRTFATSKSPAIAVRPVPVPWDEPFDVTPAKLPEPLAEEPARPARPVLPIDNSRPFDATPQPKELPPVGRSINPDTGPRRPALPPGSKQYDPGPAAFIDEAKAAENREKAAKAKAERAELAAAAKLKLQKQLLADGNREAAEFRLQQLIREYPDTKAAAEARTILGLPAKK